jgi:MOSC domain-containing protein YiiM
MQPVTEAEAVAGRGLEGDRYGQPVENGDPTAEIPLIESEAIEAAATESGVDIRLENSRRNIITSGVSLDAGRIHEVGA